MVTFHLHSARLSAKSFSSLEHFFKNNSNWFLSTCLECTIKLPHRVWVLLWYEHSLLGWECLLHGIVCWKYVTCFLIVQTTLSLRGNPGLLRRIRIPKHYGTFEVRLNDFALGLNHLMGARIEQYILKVICQVDWGWTVIVFNLQQRALLWGISWHG